MIEQWSAGVSRPPEIGFVWRICRASHVPGAPSHPAPPGKLALFRTTAPAIVRRVASSRPVGLGDGLPCPRRELALFVPVALEAGRRRQIGFVSHTCPASSAPAASSHPARGKLALFRTIGRSRRSALPEIGSVLHVRPSSPSARPIQLRRNWVRFAHCALRSPSRPAKLGLFGAIDPRGPEGQVCPQSAIEEFGLFGASALRPESGPPRCPRAPRFGFVSHISPLAPPVDCRTWLCFTLHTSHLKLQTSSNWLCLARSASDWNGGMIEHWNSGVCQPPGIGFVWHESSPPGHRRPRVTSEMRQRDSTVKDAKYAKGTPQSASFFAWFAYFAVPFFSCVFKSSIINRNS
jgi:hypothetical protein